MAINQSANLYAYVTNNPLRYVDPTGFFAEGWNRFWSGARDITAGLVTSASDFAISQVQSRVMKVAFAADALNSLTGSQGDSMMMMGMNNSVVLSANLFFSEVNDIVSEGIKQLFGVQNEALFYEARMVGNVIGMAHSFGQTAVGVAAMVKGVMSKFGGAAVTTTGILAPVGGVLVAAGGAIGVAGLSVATQGAISLLAQANIFGDNLQRRNELRRATNCDDGGPQGSGSGSQGTNIVGTDHNAFRPTQDWIDMNQVNYYADRLRAGETVKPIDVVNVPGRGFYILDGHHRYAASQLTGIPIEMNITTGAGPIGLPNWLLVTPE